MQLRPYRSQDCAALAALFHKTIHTVNARDYAPEQLDAWSTGQVDLAAWDRSFLAHRTLVAVEGEQIVGFADMDETGSTSRRTARARESRRRSATPWRAPPPRRSLRPTPP